MASQAHQTDIWLSIIIQDILSAKDKSLSSSLEYMMFHFVKQSIVFLIQQCAF
jgi:hypothetical protein